MRRGLKGILDHKCQEKRGSAETPEGARITETRKNQEAHRHWGRANAKWWLQRNLIGLWTTEGRESQEYWGGGGGNTKRGANNRDHIQPSAKSHRECWGDRKCWKHKKTYERLIFDEDEGMRKHKDTRVKWETSFLSLRLSGKSFFKFHGVDVNE